MKNWIIRNLDFQIMCICILILYYDAPLWKYFLTTGSIILAFGIKEYILNKEEKENGTV